MSRERTRLAAAALALCVVAGASTAAGQASVFVGHSGWFWANPLPQGNTLRALDFAGERGYAVGDFGTVLRSDDAGGSWAGLTTGTTAPLRVVRALSQDTIVVGGKCVVLRSDDGGASFTQLAWSLGGSCRTQLRSLAFPVPEVGYVVLSNGRVLRSADGGASWSERTAIPGTQARSASANAHPTDIFFTGVDSGFVTTDSGVVYRTSDGGTSWSPVAHAPQHLNSIFFPDPTTGYAVGGVSMLKTADGGATWSQTGIVELPEDLIWIRCASAMRCMAVTAHGDELVRTEDGGATWTSVSPSTRSLFAVGYSASGRVVAIGDAGATVTSTDGGHDFNALGGELDRLFRALRPGAGMDAYAFGPSGALAQTRDGGATWSALTPPSAQDLVDVAFADGQTGFALGRDGSLTRSDDGGRSWRLLDTGTFLHPSAVLAVDARHVLLVGPRGVRRSSDGGITFPRVRDRAVARSGLGHAGRAGRFVFVSGRHVIALSRDAGRSWHETALPERGVALVKVDFVSDTVAFALTRDGRVWTTANQGRTWRERPAIGTEVGTDIDFSDAENGYVPVSDFGGDPRGYVMRTSDGGMTWRAQLVDSRRLLPGALAALDQRSAIAIAGGNHMLATDRGGDVGQRSTLTLALARKRARPGEPGIVAITGRLQPAEGGETVVFSKRTGRSSRWFFRDATVSAGGRFTAFAAVTRTTQFVAQWSGDDDHVGAGSPVLTVGVGRRFRTHP